MKSLLREINTTLDDPNKNIIKNIRTVLNGYRSNQLDWDRYAYKDPENKIYTRNLVNANNGRYNLLILCWPPNIVSGIHDHSGSDCFVKVLQGRIRETRYDTDLQQTDVTTFNLNDVTHISDEHGYHRMENPSTDEYCITLHLYIPPFGSCNVFDQNTGDKTRSLMAFHTIDGNRV